VKTACVDVTVVNDDADMDMVQRAAVFACVGTAGQRCTTTRRIVSEPSVLGCLLNGKNVQTYRHADLHLAPVLTITFDLSTSRSIHAYSLP